MSSKYECEIDLINQMPNEDTSDANNDEYSDTNIHIITSKKKSRISLNSQIHSSTPSYYSSNGCRSRVRNARTGAYYNFYVGDKEETTLFRVTDATGVYGNKDPNQLYYDSPMEYMEHREIPVDEATLASWKTKMDNYVS
jgi:hypothetical protein